jgi:hypothetical protein
MIIKMCKDDCTTHAPFRHIIVTTKREVVRIHGRRTVRPSRTFVVCAFCRHDVTFNRPLNRCDCPASCHANARMP